VGNRHINLRRLYWVGPATMATSVAAVVIVQRSIIATLPPFPRFAESVLHRMFGISADGFVAAYDRVR
jgi:hypothetical protein